MRLGYECVFDDILSINYVFLVQGHNLALAAAEKQDLVCMI